MSKALAKASYDRGFLEKLAPSWEAYLLPGRSTDGIITGFLAEAAREPKIAQCNPTSVALCLLLCARLGFEPGSPLGHVYLIPYGGVLTPIVGYKGLLELLRRSAEVQHIEAGVVYQDELDRGLFTARFAPAEINHAWALDVDRSDEKLVAAYCSVVLTNGARQQTILDRKQIEARRGRGHDGPAWRTDYAAMARKCPIRALLASGLVPLSADDQRRVAAVWETERADGGVSDASPLAVITSRLAEHGAPTTTNVLDAAAAALPAEVEDGQDCPTADELTGIGLERHGKEMWAAILAEQVGEDWHSREWTPAERQKVWGLV